MPLDQGIARMGIFAFIFIIAFVGFIAIMPSEFAYSNPYNNPSEQVPDTWNGITLQGYNFSDTWNTTLLGSAIYSELFDIGGRNLQLESQQTGSYGNLRLAHRYGFGLLFHEDMDWYNRNNKYVGFHSGSASYIGVEEINEEFEEFGNIEFKVRCLGLGSGSSVFYVTALMEFNVTVYDTPLDAWYDSALDLLIGINPENTNYGNDMWYLVTMLLTFQTKEVFGTNDIYSIFLNGLIAGLIYAPIIIFAVVLIKELFSNWL